MARVSMSRRVTFSSGHRYWDPSLTTEQNRKRFGAWASPYNHGHNYVLWVTLSGDVDESTGMLVNIKRVDDLLRAKVVHVLDQRSLNDEVPGLMGFSVSGEQLLLWLIRALALDGTMTLPAEIGGEPNTRLFLQRLHLAETETLSAAYDIPRAMLTLTRTYEFAAAHRLHSPSLSPEQNRRLYGKCNHEAGHGHNYVLEVTVGGEPDPETGWLMNLTELDEVVEREVLDRYDHRNLDVDVPELAGAPTTSENVAKAIFARLSEAIGARLKRVKLFETARNAFEVEAS